MSDWIDARTIGICLGVLAMTLASEIVIGQDESTEYIETIGYKDKLLFSTSSDESCTAGQRERIEASMPAISRGVNHPEDLQACLEDQYISWSYGLSVEQIVARMQEPLTLKVLCLPNEPEMSYRIAGTTLQATQNIGCLGEFDQPPQAGEEVLVLLSGKAHRKKPGENEEINLRRGFVSCVDTSQLEISETILHEVGHNKWWDHPEPPERGMPRDGVLHINDQIADCSLKVRSVWGTGTKRSDLVKFWGEAELAAAGTAFEPSSDGEQSNPLKGEPFQLDCPVGTYVSGMSASFDNRIESIRLECKDLDNLDGEPDFSNWTDTRRDGTVRTAACRRVAIQTGFWGGFDNEGIRGLGLYCDVPNAIRDERLGNRTGILNGYPSGTSFVRRCRHGSTLVGLRGRADEGRVYQLTAVCRRLDHEERGPIKRARLLGRAGGEKASRYCSGNGAVNQLFGQEQKFTGLTAKIITTMGGQCVTTKWVPSEHEFNIAFESEVLEIGTLEHLLVTHGANEREGKIKDTTGSSISHGTAYLGSCPNEELLVGIRASRRVFSVVGICARYDEWDSPNAETSVVHAGGSTGWSVSNESMCSRGTFVVGFDMWADDDGDEGLKRLIGVQPVCKRLGPDFETVARHSLP